MKEECQFNQVSVHLKRAPWYLLVALEIHYRKGMRYQGQPDRDDHEEIKKALEDVRQEMRWRRENGLGPRRKKRWAEKDR